MRKLWWSESFLANLMARLHVKVSASSPCQVPTGIFFWYINKWVIATVARGLCHTDRWAANTSVNATIAFCVQCSVSDSWQTPIRPKVEFCISIRIELLSSNRLRNSDVRWLTQDSSPCISLLSLYSTYMFSRDFNPLLVSNRNTQPESRASAKCYSSTHLLIYLSIYLHTLFASTRRLSGTQPKQLQSVWQIDMEFHSTWSFTWMAQTPSVSA